MTAIDRPEPALLSSRRVILKGGAAGLFVGFVFGSGRARSQTASPQEVLAPNAFVRIGLDSIVTVIVKHLDKGQGIATGLTTIIADELDADWAQMRFEFAPSRADLYGNLFFKGFMGTGASTSMANSFDQLRHAGATARALMIATAAKLWDIKSADVTINRGIVSCGSNRASFGELIAVAATLAQPEKPQPKDPGQYRLIGVDRPGMRLDNVDKTTGKALFTIDVMREGMKLAMITHAPKFGGVPKTVNIAEVKSISGVLEVLALPIGVVVVADDTWSAIKAKRALRIEWDLSEAESRSSADLLGTYRELASAQGDVAVRKGDAAGVLASGKIIEASFEYPYLAHAAMEPVNITIQWTPGVRADLWYGCQGQSADAYAVSSILGLRPDQVHINTLWAGGSFGRRTTTGADFAVEIALIAKATGGKWPLKLQYLREDDMRGGWYRPLTYHRLRAVLAQDGTPLAWHDRIVTQSINKGTAGEALLVQNGIDSMTVEGAVDLPYAIPHFLVDVSTPKVGVPVNWWRAVGHTHTAHSTEVFIDELAAIAGKDPVEYRRALLADHPRHLGVLLLAAEKASWGTPLPRGRGRGVAVHESFGSYVANVIDVTVERDGTLRVDRVVCAVDPGLSVNPDIIRAQMEGGIGFALGAALRGEILLKEGEVAQSNFDGFEPLRLSEMPKIDVHIIRSSDPPTGIGECGVPCVSPALSNAVFAAIGKRVRSLPLSNIDLRWS
ncbi:xanthine dehydrogenase family protein molybdopterin-binding subunit [Bradyrhizobium sp. STM 3809]|uniref:xanthine dehydrogenase family protein molybdopterin-binding subunit n=1 Tax=Bradyrhizobium sp. STM 3809 TaxID=551936 RepID=UPI00054F2B30|nr:xanthine dehydrogenase family protein molybdopterin-binding subunit [Bradyrhizobium sp. STM 3809]